MQLIQPKLAKIVQKPPRTQSQALRPPSGKSAGFGKAGADAAFSRSLVEGAVCASCCVESEDSDDIFPVECSAFSSSDAMREGLLSACMTGVVRYFSVVNEKLRDCVPTSWVLIVAEDESKDIPWAVGFERCYRK